MSEYRNPVNDLKNIDYLLKLNDSGVFTDKEFVYYVSQIVWDFGCAAQKEQLEKTKNGWNDAVIREYKRGQLECPNCERVVKEEGDLLKGSCLNCGYDLSELKINVRRRE